MRERTRPLLAALSFLTAVPVARERVLETPDLRRAAALFPVVGGAVGAFVATIVWGAAHLVPPFAAAVLGVAGGVAATAALHLDGLGDVADGVGASLGGRDPAEAMRGVRSRINFAAVSQSKTRSACPCAACALANAASVSMGYFPSTRPPARRRTFRGWLGLCLQWCGRRPRGTEADDRFHRLASGLHGR